MEAQKVEVREVEVYVTANDILSGVKKDCLRCPIALAASRAFNKTIEASAKSLWNYNGECNERICDLPQTVREFIRDFDMQREVKPFSFKVVVEV